MDFRIMNFDTTPLFTTILDSDSIATAPSRHTFVRDAKAMATTPADIKEYPNAYHFIIDMPGLKSEHIKVQIEEDNVLTICGYRKKEEEETNCTIKYLRMERRCGKLMRKFVLPENADVKKIDAACKDGVLTVIVEKLQLPEKKKRRTIQIKIE